MNALVLLAVAAVVLIAGYMVYGRWLCKTWGVNDKNPTPAHTHEDGVDYVPSKPYVVLGHHFSSIAGAGPINGPIQASIFGWLPVTLWVLIGGVFFGAVHDMGALFSSIRHKGQTLATVIAENMDQTAKKLFCIFAYLTLILVVAAFASIVANTFAVGLANQTESAALANKQTAMISLLFIVIAIFWGLITKGRKISDITNIVSAIIMIVIVVSLGYNIPVIALDYTTWMLLLGVYIIVASVAPVWILLQPRDYLSSYLLYGMIILAIVGIVGATITGAAASLDIPMFTGFVASSAAFDPATGQAIVDEAGKTVTNKAAAGGYLFPALFVTIACGAISGFHSIVASGTTSKQIDKEHEVLPIAYGGMLIECLLAIISLCAVGFVWAEYCQGGYASPTAVFASGLSKMLACIPGLQNVESIAYTLLILAVSAFCMTSLDTATRLARYMFQELWLKEGEHTSDVKDGWRKVLTNKYVATLISAIAGIGLGLTGYSIIWPLFGAANQLLAALALLAVCAWLGNAGKNNKMLYIPMVFMLVVTLVSLFQTSMSKVTLLAGPEATLAAQAGGAAGVIAQLVIAILLFVLALVLAARGGKTIFGKKNVAKQA